MVRHLSLSLVTVAVRHCPHVIIAVSVSVAVTITLITVMMRLFFFGLCLSFNFFYSSQQTEPPFHRAISGNFQRKFRSISCDRVPESRQFVIGVAKGARNFCGANAVVVCHVHVVVVDVVWYYLSFGHTHKQVH